MTLIDLKCSEFTSDCAIHDQPKSKSAPQRKDLARLEPLIERAVAQMSHEGLFPNNRKWPAVCVDRGCGADEHATILTAAFVQAMQQWSSGPVQVIHIDRAAIDLKSLVRHINRFRTVTGQYSNQTEQSRTHAALHWLDLGYVSAKDYQNDETCLSEIAHTQWEIFLKTVSRELVPGGRLIISQIAVASASMREQHVPVRLVRLAAARIRRQLGVSESPNYPDWQVLPVYLRTRDEVLRPLLAEENLLSLSTELCEAEHVDCPYFTAWRQHGCNRSFAASFTNFIRAFSEWSVRIWLKSLVSQTGHHDQFSQLLHEFYQTIEQEVRQSPQDWQMRRTRIVLVARRID
ncbi:hypothetical protein [Gimesia chilikensis]|uniref:Uncharacterized protein n=1 Tax=Gimesia chilikensis TaxID=2605989 RepID=A0A517PT03_9PLAN|nr:hypothetical protein [Gimesia chilikensis]QDT22493.1 hypothetical protein HG66A1_43010 [Gimesia chilikensis]